MQKQENTTYLKAITIRDPSDLHSIKEDIKKGMILILRVTPLAQKDVEKLRRVLVNHGERRKSENLSMQIRRMYRVTTHYPQVQEAIKLF